MEMDDVIYRTKKQALILIVFQDSTLLGCVETLTGSFVIKLVLYRLNVCFCDKYVFGLQLVTASFQQQTRNDVHYNILCSLHLVGHFVH